jgi:hypothetical protein
MSGTLGFPRSSVILLCNPKDHYLLGIWNSRPELGSRSLECPIWGLRARAASGEDHIQEMWPGPGVKLLSVGTSDQRISKNWRHLSREDLRYFLILPWTVRDPSGPQKVCPHCSPATEGPHVWLDPSSHTGGLGPPDRQDTPPGPTHAGCGQLSGKWVGRLSVPQSNLARPGQQPPKLCLQRPLSGWK